MNLDELEARAREVEGVLVHLHRDELLRLVAVVTAAKYVAFSNGFDAALPQKMEALRAACAALAKEKA